MEAEPEHVNPFASPLAEEAVVSPGAPLGVSGVEAIRHEHIKREASIRSVGWLYYLGACVLTVSATFLAASAFVDPAAYDLGPSLLGAVFVALLAALGWWVGAGLRRLNPTVRIPALVLSIIALLISLLGINVIGMLIHGYLASLMGSEKSKYIFSPEYKEIIAATPHIRYKSSTVMWVVLGVLLVVLVVVVVFAARMTP